MFDYYGETATHFILSTQVILKGLKGVIVTTPITLVPVCWAEVVPI